ncbi:hypothetical protein E4U42_006049 [Claviceps africana]|uniref:Putative lipoate-protein ligase A n=1 Tax=Claviceps africana TaxID=83212 RepID=A0A8K0NFZ1_9HYPO|nr:hypothetical protein E4U42_006049 [Claviceps africana]
MATWAASLRGTRCALASSRRHVRCFSVEAAAHPSNKTQVYLSRSNDALVNLSVEHRLLQITPPESTVLILYVNAPCVVFGRNQNPWLELNLARLAQIANRPHEIKWKDSAVRLVRRRSGGGTVFHDLGNVNFSVICPPRVFDRDKHAEMVVRALQSLGRPRTSVNERHDIVIDVDTAGAGADETSTFKISGSAYKLTRLRSLHHGTCLLRSPNLSDISGMLRSPAEPFVRARGVDSVRSPVRNVDLDNHVFQDAVIREFGRMYGSFDVQAEFNHDALEDPQIRAGHDELTSKDWIYGQTPRFSFSTHSFEDDPRPRPEIPFQHRLYFEARHGLIEKFRICGPEVLDTNQLPQVSLQDVADWELYLRQAGLGSPDAQQLGTWMNKILGTEFTRMPSPAISAATS